LSTVLYTVLEQHVGLLSVSTCNITFFCIFTARRYASAVYTVDMCSSVCMFVRPSHAGIVPKQLNLEQRKQLHTIAHLLWFYEAKDVGEIPSEAPLTGATNAGRVGSDQRFLTNVSLYLRNGAR